MSWRKRMQDIVWLVRCQTERLFAGEQPSSVIVVSDGEADGGSPPSSPRLRQTTFGATLDFIEALCDASSGLTAFAPVRVALPNVLVGLFSQEACYRNCQPQVHHVQRTPRVSRRSTSHASGPKSTAPR